LPCGAGHDAAVFAAQGVPTGMLFIRNANGSHNPAEAMSLADFAMAAGILMRFCLNDLRG
ncbi:MAG: M20/M25/M40 family metallo-hydrolase, partial [Hyphomonadaceae bacterium]